MITKNNFLVLVNEAMDCDQASNLSLELESLESWDSIAALSLMSLIDDELGIQLKPSKMEASKTLQDIYIQLNEDQ